MGCNLKLNLCFKIRGDNRREEEGEMEEVEVILFINNLARIVMPGDIAGLSTKHA